jgi:uncharacterized protein
VAHDAFIPVFSCIQARAILAAQRQGQSQVQSSLDLGVTPTVLDLGADGVTSPDGTRLTWQQVEQLIEHENVCFELEAGELTPIRGYSSSLRRTYQLMPTEAEPALLLSGFIMHRVRDVSPREGAQAMVKAILPVRGRLLDTATGLGYAAIEASLHAAEVVSVELDPLAQEMARRNPWSRALFDNPRIQLCIGDSGELIRGFEAGSFAAVVHDPPAINLAGELYAEEFYVEVLRVLGRGGRFFHYIGDPNSASGGRVTKGVMRRLMSAGFRKIVPKADAFGVLALK